MTDAEYTSPNPFWIAELSTNATTIEVRRRITELLTQVGLGIAKPGLDESAIQQVRVELEDPVKRLRSELRWLLWDSPALPTSQITSISQLHTLSTLLRQHLELADDAIGPLINHDLAVIATEIATSAPADITIFTEAFVRWQVVFESPEFRSRIHERAQTRNDTRLNHKAVDELIDELRTYSARRTLQRVSRGALQSRTQILDALRTAKVHDTSLNLATELLLTPEVQQLSTNISDLAQLVDSISVHEDQATLQQTLIQARTLVLDKIRPSLELLQRTNPSPVSSTQLDSIATLIGSLGKAFAYGLDDFQNGVSLARLALKTASRPSLQSSIAVDLTKLLRNYFVEQANLSGANNDPIGLIAAMELAADHSDPSERAELHKQAAELRRIRQDVRPADIAARKQALWQSLTLGAPPLQQLVASPGSSRTTIPRQSPYAPQPATPPAASPPDTSSTGRRWWLWFLILILVLIGISRWYSDHNSASDQQPSRTDTSQTTNQNLPPDQTAAYVLNEGFGYPQTYETSRDSNSAVRYSENALVIEVFQPELVYFLHPVSNVADQATLAVECTHVSGLGGGCSLLWQSEDQSTLYSLEVEWELGIAYAWVSEFVESNSSTSAYLSGPIPARTRGSSAMLSITLQSSHLYFQVNGQTVFSTRTIHAPPQEVGFGAFMNDAETSTFQARDAIVVSFDNLTLKELAE